MRILLLLAACSSSSAPLGGGVSFLQEQSGWSVSAAFSAPLQAETKCIHVAGDCQAIDDECAKTLPSPAPPKLYSAGVITVGPATLTPKSDGSYDAVTGMASAGSAIAVEAAGAEVAAFSGTINVPPPATLMPPPAITPRDQDLTVSWSGGAAGARLSLLVFTVTMSPAIQINCSFDAGAGSGVIPSALLQRIPAGADGHFSGLDVEITSQPRPTITLTGAARVDGFASSTFN